MRGSDAETVKAGIDITEEISTYIPNLRQQGGNKVGLCPFHYEKTPSFTINESLQIFKCFGCGKGGDVITFIMEIENISFIDALRHLAEKYNIKLSSHNKYIGKKESKYSKIKEINNKVHSIFINNLSNKERNKIVIQYLEKRNIKIETAKFFELGYANSSGNQILEELKKAGVSTKEQVESGNVVKTTDVTYSDKFKNRLIFPIFDERNTLCGFSGRYIEINQDKRKKEKNFTPPKYLNTGETLLFKKYRLFFGLKQAKQDIKRKGFVITTEGQMNVLSSHQANIHNIVAHLGTTLSEYHCKILKSYTNEVCIAYDKDTAGKKALIKNAKTLLSNDMNVTCCVWDKKYGKDPDELILSNPSLWIKSVKERVSILELLSDTLRNSVKHLSDTQVTGTAKTLQLLLESVSNPAIRYKYRDIYSAILKTNTNKVNQIPKKETPLADSLTVDSNLEEWERSLLRLLIYKLDTEHKRLLSDLLLSDPLLPEGHRVSINTILTLGVSRLAQKSFGTNDKFSYFIITTPLQSSSPSFSYFDYARELISIKISMRKALLSKSSERDSSHILVKEIKNLQLILAKITKETYKNI